MKQKTDYSLDIRRSIVPYALLKASQAFREMKGGETMEILVSDPDARKDLLKILPARLFELVRVIEEDTYCRIFIRKQLKQQGGPVTWICQGKRFVKPQS